MPTDWTVVLDDLATKRLRTCTLCGGEVPEVALDAWSNGRVTVAVALCPRCQRRDSQRTDVQAVLVQRYGAAPADPEHGAAR